MNDGASSMIRVTSVLGSLLALSSPDVQCQNVGGQPPSVESVSRSIAAGGTVRVRRRDRSVISGPFAGIADSSLLIANTPVPFGNVDSLWVARRATGKGAGAGAFAAGIIGAAGTSVAFYALARSWPEDDDRHPVKAAAYGGVFGGVVGAGSGAILGAVIGSGVRRWKLVYAGSPGVPFDERPTPVSVLPPQDSVTSPDPPRRKADHYAIMRATVAWGHGVGTGSAFGALGARLSYLSLGRRNARAGIEVGWQGLGSWDLVVGSPSQNLVSIEGLSMSVLQFATVARIGKSSGRMRSYLTGGLGANIPYVPVRSFTICRTCPRPGAYRRPPFSGQVIAGVSLGGGVDLVSKSSARSIGMEARVHLNPAFVTVGGTVGTGW